MVTISIKCHLCKQDLTESTGKVWQVGKRHKAVFNCVDKLCRSLRPFNRCRLEIVMPEQEITDYIILVEDQLREQWYRILASGSNGPGTSIHKVNVQTGYEPELISVPKFYPLSVTDDFTTKGLELVNRLKNLVIFT